MPIDDSTCIDCESKYVNISTDDLHRIWLLKQLCSESASNYLEIDTFDTEIGVNDYLRPDLSGKTIIAVKQGQVFVDEADYSLSGGVLTLSIAPDSIQKVVVFYV